MVIVLPDEISLHEAIIETRHRWIMTHKKDGITDAALALQLGVSSRTVLRWKLKKRMTKNNLVAPGENSCVFCGKSNELYRHHVDGKNHFKQIILLCQGCHRRFHSLNIKFAR